MHNRQFLCCGCRGRMLNCGLMVKHGRAKVWLGMRRFLDFRKMLPSLKLVEQTSWIILTGLENFIEFVQACVHFPKKAVLVCLHIQKQIVLFPFWCMGKIYSQLTNSSKANFPKVTVTRSSSPIQILTGESHPSPERVITACKQIRSSAIKSISRSNPSIRIQNYKQQLEKWRLESEKRTEEIYKIGAEDKELMKAVASGLRCLKAMKKRRDSMHSFYNKNISTMIDNGTATGEKLLSMKKSIKVADSAILEKKNACLDLLGQGQLDYLSDSGYTSPVKTDLFQNMEEDLDPSVETMQKVLGMVTEENTMLRNQLSCTVKKLEDILNVSININHEMAMLNDKFAKMNAFNDEMVNLQDKLDEEREMLVAVQADRDIMKHKLKTLEILIKEEEEFLGDSKYEFSFEDSDMGSLASEYDLDFSSSSR